MTEFIAQFLLLAFCNSLLIIGLFESVQFEVDEYKKWKKPEELEPGDFAYKMIFYKFALWARIKFGEFWSKPVITCCVCMSSLHSTYVFWPVWYLFMPHDLTHALAYLFYVPLLAGVTTVIVNIIYE